MGRPVCLHRLTFSMECDVDGAPLGALFVGYLCAGEITYHYGEHMPDSPVYGPGDVFLAVEPDVPYDADLSGADLHFAALGPSLLAQVAGSPPSTAMPTGFCPAIPCAANPPAEKPAEERRIGAWRA
jgi:hypothetical protein